MKISRNPTIRSGVASPSPVLLLMATACITQVVMVPGIVTSKLTSPAELQKMNSTELRHNRVWKEKMGSFSKDGGNGKENVT